MDILCKIRDLQKAMEQFERQFETEQGISLKEGMILCSLKEKQLSATELAEKTSLTNSNCSKMINSVENKGYIERTLGKEDKRNMFFTLSEKGKNKLETIQKHEYNLPLIFENIFTVI